MVLALQRSQCWDWSAIYLPFSFCPAGQTYICLSSGLILEIFKRSFFYFDEMFQYFIHFYEMDSGVPLWFYPCDIFKMIIHDWKFLPTLRKMNNLFNYLLSSLCVADTIFLISNVLVLPFHFSPSLEVCYWSKNSFQLI